MTNLTFSSDVFDVEQLTLGDRVESIVRGSRKLFARLPEALAGIQTIAVLGWGSQGPAQARNLRDSLAGTGIQVIVGLASGSASFASAREAGFREEDGTLGELFDMCSRADLALLLIADAAQAELHTKVFGALRPGATLGLSHGFLAAHLDSIGEGFPDHIDVIAVCPKGMGPSVRRLYEQGADIDGAGINVSFAIEQDVSGRAVDRALGWAVAIGAPAIFRTTLRSECTSDVFGERGILLGAAHGIVESLYRRLVDQGVAPEEAFERTCENVTGPIRRTISTAGLLAVRAALGAGERATFDRAYASAHAVAMPLLSEIYDEVASGNEIRSVVAAHARLSRYPMARVEAGTMWTVGAEVRRTLRGERLDIDPFTAGTFVGVMVAQVDVLAANGHPWSEIANETVIEAVDPLLPYMHARGVAFMIDNCSTTARLGARRWGPRFDFDLSRTAYPLAETDGPIVPDASTSFGRHAIHGVLDVLRPLRPTVDIAVD
jgi:ketol-acid reductoisomerase